MKTSFLKYKSFNLDILTNCHTFASTTERMKKLAVLLVLALITLAPLVAQKAEKAVVVATTETSLSVIQTGKTLQLQNATVGDKMEVLSIVGVRIVEKKIESSNQTFTLELPKGYYIVKIGTAVRKISVK